PPIVHGRYHRQPKLLACLAHHGCLTFQRITPSPLVCATNARLISPENHSPPTFGLRLDFRIYLSQPLLNPFIILFVSLIYWLLRSEPPLFEVAPDLPDRAADTKFPAHQFSHHLTGPQTKPKL